MKRGMKRGTRPRTRWSLGLVVAVLATQVGLIGVAPGAAAAPGDALTFSLGTTPPIAGFPLTLDGVTAKTDADGVAHFRPKSSDLALEDRVDLTKEAVLRIHGQDVKLVADRVYDSETGTPLVSLAQFFLVSFRYLRPDGSKVDPSEIGDVVLRSETGQRVTVNPKKPEWLQGTRVIKRTGEMQNKRLRWSVLTVEYSGSNVVNAAQQVFEPATTQKVDIDLLFYRLDVQVHDAIFGFETGDGIELVYPDGGRHRLALDEHGALSVAWLPRGKYTLRILGSGPGMERPLAVTSEQVLDLDFYSWLDIGTVLGGLLLLAGGLALTGRIRRRRDRADVVDQHEEPAEDAVPVARRPPVPPKRPTAVRRGARPPEATPEPT
jgi:hypothetical protein